MVCLPSLVPGIRLACPNSRELPSTGSACSLPDKEKVNVWMERQRGQFSKLTHRKAGVPVSTCAENSGERPEQSGRSREMLQARAATRPAGKAEEPRGAVNFNVVSLLSKTPPHRIKTEWNRAHTKEQQRTLKEEIRCNEEVKRSRG